MPKVGDKVRVVDNTSGHSYEIGSIVKLVRKNKYNHCWHGGADHAPWLNPSDFVIIKEQNGFKGFMRRMDDVQARR